MYRKRRFGRFALVIACGSLLMGGPRPVRAQTTGTISDLGFTAGEYAGDVRNADHPSSAVANITAPYAFEALAATGEDPRANPAPEVTGITPGFATTGSGPLAITLTGTNFVAASEVRWGGHALNVTYISDTELTAVISASDLTTAGTFFITVVNPAPGGGTFTESFAVVNPVPSITEVDPSSGTADSGPVAITLTGSGFLKRSEVQWGGHALKMTYVSDTELTAVIPASDLTATGNFIITVTNPGPDSGTAFYVFAVVNPVPIVSSIKADSDVTGSPNLTVTAKGTGFVKESVALWGGSGGTPLATTFKSATELTFVIPKSDLTAEGVYEIAITNPAPDGGTSELVQFTVDNAKPTLTKLSVSTAPEGSSDLTVTATGKGFAPTSEVQWEGTTLATTYVSSTELTFTIPAADLTAKGAYKITVATPAPGGGTSGAVVFNVKSASTGTGTSGSDLSPLTAGFTWTYQYSSTSETLVLVAKGLTTFQGAPAYEVDATVTTTAGTSTESEFSTITSGGLYSLGTILAPVAPETTATTIVIAPPALKIPADLTPGYTWNQSYVETISSVVSGQTESIKENISDIGLIVGLETVTVPAGTFNNAVHIRHTTEVLVSGAVSSSIVSDGWYVKGIGLVQTSTTASTSDTTTTGVLVSYSK